MQKIAVTGASGQLGQGVIRHLLAAGHNNIVAITRDPSKLSALKEKSVDIRAGDFLDPLSLDAAFKGVDSLLIISTNTLDGRDTRRIQHKNAVDAAQRAGVGHVVYTSMPNPEPPSAIPFAPDHFETEQALKASGLHYTILRNNWYMENLLMSLPAIIASGVWLTSAGDGRVGHVTRDDCARVAAQVLLQGAASNATVDVTGGKALAVKDMAAALQKATGKTIAVKHVSGPEHEAILKSTGLPDFWVSLITASDANTRAGRVDIVTDAVEKWTGNPPESFDSFAARLKLTPP